MRVLPAIVACRTWIIVSKDPPHPPTLHLLLTVRSPGKAHEQGYETSKQEQVTDPVEPLESLLDGDPFFSTGRRLEANTKHDEPYEGLTAR